jgi:hypothetical protein
MTKNLHEPSNETEIARQGYRIRQLERRPASTGGAGGGASCLPYAIISFAQFPGETVASDTETLFGTLPDFGDEYESDSAVFDTDGANGKINIFERGLYLAEASIQWDGDISGIKLVRVEWSGTEFTGEALTTVSEISIDEDETTQRSLVFVTGEPVASVTATFEQRSGSPQDVIRAAIKVIKLADYPATDDCSAGGAPVSWLSLDADTSVASGPPATTILAGAENSFDSDPTVLLADTANGWIDILEPGFYLAKFRGCWGSAATTVSALISWEADTIGSSPCGSSFDLFEDASGSAWGLTGSDLIVDIAATSRVRPSIQHVTGAPRDVTFAYLAVTRVSPYDETPSS